MEIIHATEESFEREISYQGTILIDFFANWCGPCKMLSPILESVALKKEELKIIKVNVDECPSLARTYGVMSIPTLVLLKEGKQVSSQVGFMPEEDLLRWIDEAK